MSSVPVQRPITVDAEHKLSRPANGALAITRTTRRLVGAERLKAVSVAGEGGPVRTSQPSNAMFVRS